MSYDTEWHYVGETGEPDFENDCSNLGGSNCDIRFIKGADGVVRIEGGVYSEARNEVCIFTLPIGYRPNTQTTGIQTMGPDEIYRVFINTDGTVVPYRAFGTLNISFFVGPVVYNSEVVCDGGESGESMA